MSAADSRDQTRPRVLGSRELTHGFKSWHNLPHQEGILARERRLFDRWVIQLHQISTSHNVVAHQFCLVIAHVASTLHGFSLGLLAHLGRVVEEGEGAKRVLRLQHIDAVEHLAGRAVQASAKALLYCLFVYEFECRQNIVHFLRLLDPTASFCLFLQMTHVSRRMELFCDCCVLEILIVLLGL